MCRTRRDCQTRCDDPADAADPGATEADVGGVSAIYDPHAVSGYATFETAPPPAATWLGKIHSTEPGDHFLVAEAEGRLAGFAYSGPYRPRPAYRHTREVSVYLGPEARGRGLGRRLYDDLLTRLDRDAVHTVVAAVALPNDASEALHRSLGFERAGVLREVGRKHDRWIDVALWQRLR